MPAEVFSSARKNFYIRGSSISAYALCFLMFRTGLKARDNAYVILRINGSVIVKKYYF
jgi:hypothetical protein